MKEKVFWFLAVALLSGGLRSLFAAEAASTATQDEVYRGRAEKIVATLDLKAEEEKRTRVRDAIAEHYRNVNAIDDALQAKLEEIKQAPSTDKSAAEVAAKTARDEAQPRLDKAHTEFLAKLSADLTSAEIDQVKDGLTYGVLQVTWNAYQKMYPDLTPEQKDQIMAWLKEAREHAMDAGSSDKKHAWFGKYKGRINNYLSKAGYNAKEAEKNLTKKS